MVIKFFFSLALLFVFFRVAEACSCEIGSHCYFYSTSESVFVGKVINVKDGGEKNGIDVTFSVIENFKAAEVAEKVVKFIKGDCFERQFVVNEEYFVYSEKGGIVSQCNPTSRLDKDSIHYVQAQKRIGELKDRYVIGGIVRSDHPIDPDLITIEIESVSDMIRKKLDPNSRFLFELREHSGYRVKIHLPKGWRVLEISDGSLYIEPEVIEGPEGVLTSYLLTHTDASCHEMNIRISRVE